MHISRIYGPASAGVLGLVKVGSGLAAAADGTLSATGSGSSGGGGASSGTATASEVTMGALAYPLTTTYAAIAPAGQAPLAVSLPAAGYYKISAVVQIQAGTTANDDIRVKLYNATLGAAIGGSEQCAGSLAASALGQIVIDQLVYVAAASVIQVWAVNNTAARGSVPGRITIAGANLVPAMTSDTAPSGTASGSSNYSGTDFYEAFTGNLTPSGWSNAFFLNGTTTGWLQYQFPSAVLATSYGISGNGGSGYNTARNPSAWTFEGSNDGSTWTTLDTRTGISTLATGTLSVFSFTNTTAYAYYRLNITANNGGDGYTGIGQLQIYSLGTYIPASSRVSYMALGSGSGITTCAALPLITGVSPSYGEGVAITITGSGFTGATGVTINGVACTSVVVVSDTEITCVSPSSFSAGAVVVTTAAGAATSGGSFGASTPALAYVGSATASGGFMGGANVNVSYTPAAAGNLLIVLGHFENGGELTISGQTITNIFSSGGWTAGWLVAPSTSSLTLNANNAGGSESSIAIVEYTGALMSAPIDTYSTNGVITTGVANAAILAFNAGPGNTTGAPSGLPSDFTDTNWNNGHDENVHFDLFTGSTTSAGTVVDYNVPSSGQGYLISIAP
ncbi:MAG: IPT/TIG domain-containing protein [Capsulimonadaceae bacterium]|nr:IPT/TIG domain-containing protein [Capsulimonadaceae bacterium]